MPWYDPAATDCTSSPGGKSTKVCGSCAPSMLNGALEASSPCGFKPQVNASPTAVEHTVKYPPRPKPKSDRIAHRREERKDDEQ